MILIWFVAFSCHPVNFLKHFRIQPKRLRSDGTPKIWENSEIKAALEILFAFDYFPWISFWLLSSDGPSAPKLPLVPALGERFGR